MGNRARKISTCFVLCLGSVANVAAVDIENERVLESSANKASSLLGKRGLTVKWAEKSVTQENEENGSEEKGEEIGEEKPREENFAYGLSSSGNKPDEVQYESGAVATTYSPLSLDSTHLFSADSVDDDSPCAKDSPADRVDEDSPCAKDRDELLVPQVKKLAYKCDLLTLPVGAGFKQALQKIDEWMRHVNSDGMLDKTVQQAFWKKFSKIVELLQELYKVAQEEKCYEKSLSTLRQSQYELSLKNNGPFSSVAVLEPESLKDLDSTDAHLRLHASIEKEMLQRYRSVLVELTEVNLSFIGVMKSAYQLPATPRFMPAPGTPQSAPPHTRKVVGILRKMNSVFADFIETTEKSIEQLSRFIGTA